MTNDQREQGEDSRREQSCENAASHQSPAEQVPESARTGEHPSDRQLAGVLRDGRSGTDKTPAPAVGPSAVEVVKQEIFDLFARYGSGDYTPTEEEKEILHAGLDTVLEELAALDRLRAENEQIRDALAGQDYASLPSDYPTVRMAHTIRAERDKYLHQVRDTCQRAERAEAALGDCQRLTRELDVVWNGEQGAAKQPSLCDVLSQIRKELPALRGGVVVPEDQIKLIWRAAMTAATNVCIERSNRHNGNDDSERCEEANDCSRAIQVWIEPDEGHVQELQAMLAAAKEGK